MAGIQSQPIEQESPALLGAGQPGRSAFVKGNHTVNNGGTRFVGFRRSGPRSRGGCVTCKQRRVRCDEIHPICGHCVRLQLNCHYRPQAKKSLESGSRAGLRNADARNDSLYPVDVQVVPTSLQNTTSSTLSPFPHSHPANTGDGAALADLSNLEMWSYERNFDYIDLAEDLSTSWAGEFSCLFPDGSSMAGSTLAVERHESARLAALDEPISVVPDEGNHKAPKTRKVTPSVDIVMPSISGLSAPLPQEGQPAGLGASPQGYHPAMVREDSPSERSHHYEQLIRRFLRIAQPPAAILIGGSKRWRCLQEYLCKTSQQSRPVESALLCIVGLLTIDETCKELAIEREQCMIQIHAHHTRACEDIRTKLARNLERGSKWTEQLLAAIFLLAWFEVIHDQDARQSQFPRELADSIILSKSTWSRSSQELLSWMNTLDSKATHLGGEHLLSEQTVEAISRYQTEITSTSRLEGEASRSGILSDGSDGTPTNSTPGSAGSLNLAPTRLQAMGSLITQRGQVKQAVLNAVIQPALQWYLTSQSYCRRISAHDKYHRRRVTSDDEYEVITACKQLESELSELWNFRPTVMSLTAEQLREVVSTDLATRLEEVFSVYLASFWILFVYLHRVSWWHLPHSELVERALSEVWRNMQRAYGEVIDGTSKRVVHPSLLWPLFLFGSECIDRRQREWAIQQLEDLGAVKPVLEDEEVDSEMLPPFRLSSGATRNAKRAAVLLTRLTEEQDKKKRRVDDRELSMKLFGCHFSIV
ncbi:hypothetical protein LTR84_006826 [Exophiala bonariae]|uniref:Zn(2)-C6 fungal-type domain-containing protein n=1 Tax=Exophiala bonariae TaxID=1690606 RepID=A0AAV9N009_9EURO|nr:hypothetical protein LTR84_006826 [Exophiala bonariae]